MATKSLFTPALLALKKTEITTNASTLVFVRHLQQNAKKNNVAPSATASPAMGRAGYDTTNMKVATRPRLANKGTDKSDTHSAKHHASVSQQQQRGEGVGGTSDGALGKAQASEKNASKLRRERERNICRAEWTFFVLVLLIFPPFR